VGDRLDILVANAGISKAATIEETTVEDFDKLFAVNVRGPFFLVQQLLPILSKGGSIVLVSSLAARAVVVFPHNCLNNQRSFDGSQVKLLARKKL
jgi:3-oxoacyl-[acyl-carrier protein] reductase